MAGPTAHEFVLPPCPGCPESYAGLSGLSASCPDPSALPSPTLQLRPGSYLSFATSSVDATTVEAHQVDPGFSYTNCLYIDPHHLISAAGTAPPSGWAAQPHMEGVTSCVERHAQTVRD